MSMTKTTSGRSLRQHVRSQRETHREWRRWQLGSRLRLLCVALGSVLLVNGPVIAQSAADRECRRVAILEMEATATQLQEVLTLANSPIGMLALGALGPVYVTEVSGGGPISIEAREITATHVGGTHPQRTCRVRVKVNISYSRAAIEPDTRPETSTSSIRRPIAATLAQEVTYDMTFAGTGENVEILETEFGDLMLQALALDAQRKNLSGVTREMHQAIAEKETLIRRRQDEAARAEFEAREAANRRMQEHRREDDERRRREQQALQERAARDYAEEARRQNAERVAREQAHDRMLRLERLQGYLTSAQHRLSRLTRPNERADQQRRIDEIRAQIAAEEAR